MRNYVGVYDLFGENKLSKKAFLEWSKEQDDFCEYDLDRLVMDLYVPAVLNTHRYFHFNTGNILDWLESCGYYIGLPVRGEFQYGVEVHYDDPSAVWYEPPIYRNDGVENRNEALELGVTKAIEALEKQLCST